MVVREAPIQIQQLIEENNQLRETNQKLHALAQKLYVENIKLQRQLAAM